MADERDDIQNEDNPFTDGEVKRGLRWSIGASAVGTVYYGILIPSSWLVVAMLTFLGVSRPMIGVLGATLPLARVVEVAAAWAMQRTGRRRELFTWAHIVSRLLWIPLVFVWFISGEYAAGRAPVLFAILLASGILAWLGSNAWLSWMGDLIPPNVRGRYFGVRQIFETGVRIFATWCIAAYLQRVGTPAFEHYLTVVCILVVFGIVDILIFRFWVPHPPLAPTRSDAALVSIAAFVSAPLRDRNYRSFVVFLGLWMFSSSLMGPYIWVFVNDKAYLGLDFMFNFRMQFISGAFYMAASWVWGQLGDRWPAKRGLALCVLISMTPPFYYLFATRTFTLPITMAWIVGTVAWAGIFVYGFQCGIAMAPARERSMYLAFQSAVLGLVSAAAYFSASALVKLMEGMEPLHVGRWTWTDLQLIFCLAGLGRALSLIPLAFMRHANRS